MMVDGGRESALCVGERRGPAGEGGEGRGGGEFGNLASAKEDDKR